VVGDLEVHYMNSSVILSVTICTRRFCTHPRLFYGNLRIPNGSPLFFPSFPFFPLPAVSSYFSPCTSPLSPKSMPLYSARFSRLLVPSVKLCTVRGRAFQVVARLSGTIGRTMKLQRPLYQRLKTYMFFVSFPDIILD